jgi:thymidine kinase
MAKLYFRYSAMNAGKSTALLQVAHNYEEQGRRIVIYTAAVDDRFGVGRVTSRLGIGRDALIFDNQFDFMTMMPVDGIACVLIDEAQFMTPEQVVQLHQVAQLKGVPVICYGLRSDFQGKAFPGAAHLLALADDLEEMKTVCGCGKKATMNLRVDEHGQPVREGAQVEIGNNNRYRPVCARCYYSATQPAAKLAA